MPAKQSRGDREKHATASRAAVNVRSIFDSNQFQIIRCKDFPFRVVYLHSKGLSGAFVQSLKTCLAGGEEITFSPLTQSNDDREQLSAFWGQGIFPIGTAVRSRHLFHDSARNQLLEARAQDVLCQPQALLKIREAPYATEGITNDKQRPPFADRIERACHGAQVGFEGFVSHGSSYLMARKSGCTIIPDSGIPSVVASYNQTERRRVARLIRLQELKCNTRAELKLRGGIHTNEKHRQSSGTLRTDDEKRAQEKFHALRRRSPGSAGDLCRRSERSSG